MLILFIISCMYSFLKKTDVFTINCSDFHFLSLIYIVVNSVMMGNALKKL